ncbi:MAG: hypothetical protein ABI791_13255 [Acidobacteriota bacterium]
MQVKTNSNKDKKKCRKRTARVICHDQNEFWTTQTQFWQWVRERKVVQLHHNPLTGMFTQPHEESMVVICNTVLNTAHRNHLNEALSSRRLMKSR